MRLIDPKQAYEIARLGYSDFALSLADLTSLREVLEDCDTIEVPTWIPVTERLPEDDTDVLAFCGTTGKFYETAYLCYGKWFDCWDGTEIVCVTHWMPLPTPPKDGDT